MQRHLGSLIDRRAAGRLARQHQVACEFGLAIGRDHLAAGQPVHVDGMAGAAKHQLDAVMRGAALVYAGPDAGLAQQIDRDLLEDARPDAAEHVVAALALDDDVVDARLAQQLAE